jgi:hypothetical protein
MEAYLKGIYLFKTNKELALNVLKKYTRVDDVAKHANRLRGNVATADSRGPLPEQRRNLDDSRPARQSPPAV